MAKKEDAALTIVSSVAGGETVPSLSELRSRALRDSGLISPRKKYKSSEERKGARKARAKARREERDAYLEEQGLGRRKRPKLTKVQRREKSKAKAQSKRRAFNEMLRGSPEAAKKLGIDISRLRV